MKITIDTRGYDLVARDEDGKILARRKTNCNPAALAQIVADAEAIGEIDWKESQVEKPTHGGKRPGSGRKARETVRMELRVKSATKLTITKTATEQGKTLGQVVDERFQ